MNPTHFETYLRTLDRFDDVQGVLAEEWIIHPPGPDYGYDQTPSNALTFAAMGCDGVHFAILTLRGVVLDDSPVLQISPMDEDCYSVLGNSFIDFLSRGTGLQISELQSAFDAERNGVPTLVDLLKARFQISRVWDSQVIDLDPFQRWIIRKPNSRT